MLSGEISMKLAINNCNVSGNTAEEVFEVKGQGHSKTRCTFAVELINGVASRLMAIRKRKWK